MIYLTKDGIIRYRRLFIYLLELLLLLDLLDDFDLLDFPPDENDELWRSPAPPRLFRIPRLEELLLLRLPPMEAGAVIPGIVFGVNMSDIV